MRWNLLPSNRQRRDLHEDLARSFDRFFDDFLPWSTDSLQSVGFTPNVEVQEDDKGLHIRAELPGLDEKDVELSVQDDVLTLKGEKKQEEEHTQGKTTTREISYGYFSRSFRLPAGVDPDRIKARCKKGVLQVDVPLPDEVRKQHKPIQIEVK